MSNESKSDLVVEARELLSKATPGPWTVKPIEGQAEFEIADAKRDWQVCCVAGYAGARRLDGNYESEANADLIARTPDLLSSLCNELEQLRSQHTAAREAIGFAINVLNKEFPGSIMRKAAIAKLQASITPKGEQE